LRDLSVTNATTSLPAMAEPPLDSASDESSPGAIARTWGQRATIAALLLGAIAAFAAAGALAVGQWVVASRNLVVLADQDAALGAPSLAGTDEIRTPSDPGSQQDPGDAEAVAEFPPAEPAARNFLITGADNNACIDPDSRFAPAFGDREAFGERSDTIMVWRVNPATQQVAVLSLPRDLFVEIPGSGRGRINTAYRRDDPELLRATILKNFGIPIDHYVQVDFCAFKRLVDAVGGVEVPFEFPARDYRSGLMVPEVGCYNFEGDHALAYVRSRYYEYEDPPGSGNWRRDGTSDLGRISRQQDFLRRTVASVLGRGAYTPSVVSALIETNRSYLTIDSGLTLNRMLEFAGILQALDPETIGSYQIEAARQFVGSADVLVPRLNGANMAAILAVFRGEATLADAPEQVFDPTPTTVARPGETTTSLEPGTDPSPTIGPLPEVSPQENLVGVAPPRDVRC